MTDDTQAQIASVLFHAVLDGKTITDKQKKQLADFIGGMEPLGAEFSGDWSDLHEH